MGPRVRADRGPLLRPGGFRNCGFGGYPIPAGSTIYVSLCAVHRLPELWPDPHRFDPERFAPEPCAARPRFAFIPFAAGHRNCVGGSMAMTELKLADEGVKSMPTAEETSR